MPSPKSNKQPLLTLRTAVVLLCALIVGAAAGGLTYLGTKELTSAVLAGGTAFAGAVIWLDKIIAG
jgi:hypothetical protein